MKKRKSQLQNMLEDLLPDDVEKLIHDAFASFDRGKVEKFVRSRLDGFDADKLEDLARDVVRDLDTDKLKKLLQHKLGNLDTGKLEHLLAEGARHLDRRSVEDRIRAQIKGLDLDKIRRAAQARMAALDAEAVDKIVRERADAIVQERLSSLNPRELKALARAKQRDLKRAGRSARKSLASGVHEVARQTDALATQIEPRKSVNPITAVLGATGRLAFLSAAGWIAYSHFLVDHQVPLPKAFPAEQMTLAFKPTGPLNLYVDRSVTGRPLLLVHSVNAAASSYEMRPLFSHFRGQRPVFALDLPGFGFSARPKAEYTPDIFVQAILTAAATIGTDPVDVITLSLGSEFVAEAARRKPELFHSLTLMSPSGMDQSTRGRGSQAAAANGLDAWLLPLLSFPLWGRPFFDLLTTRASIKYFLQKSFVGAVPGDMIDYANKTGHQPGGEHAPFAFVSGRLFTANAAERIYRKVETPTLVLYDRDAFVSFERLPELLATNKTWQAKRIAPTLGMPHWERTPETVEAIASFWKGLD
jgi:pimeloyl-ACP methyl ester carboxylesterase